MPFPAPGFFTSNPTGGEGLQALDDLVARTRQQIGADGVSDETIASGEIVPTSGSVRLFGQGGAADILTTLDPVNFADGQLVELRIGDENQPVTIEHNSSPAAGEVELLGGLDHQLNDLSQRLVLQLDGTTWLEWDRGGREKVTQFTLGSYLNSWTSSAFAPRYWKDSGGVVHLLGFPTHAALTGSASDIYPLPAGYRPNSSITMRVPIYATVAGAKEVHFLRIIGSTGVIGWERASALGGASVVVLDLSSVSFRAEG